MKMPKASLHKSSRSNSCSGCGAPLIEAPSIFLACFRPRKHQDYFFDVLPVAKNLGIIPRQLEIFSLREIQVATDNFSPQNIIGRGGYGTVYKGHLPDGSVLAVKRLKEEPTRHGEAQFQTEVEMISRALHRNLLRLRGFCMTSTERLLIYPLMVNGSVASWLRERPETQSPLSWKIRKRIALEAARGLAYLHDHCNPKIIHRDVRAANILLDHEFEAVVGDFGLVKLMELNDTHVTTIVCGTTGHIAPEYLSTGKSSEKTDVFSYGVMLLELITGQRTLDLVRQANDDDVMVQDWVKGHLQEKKLDTLVDADLQGSYFADEVEHLLQIALLCTRKSPMERPKMSQIVRLLSMHSFNKRSNGDPDLKTPTTSPRSIAQLLPSSSLASTSILAQSQQVKHQNQVSKMPVENDKGIFMGQLKYFSLRDIVDATDDFNPAYILGKGAFGSVYKGELPGGHAVAIKRLKEKHTQVEKLQFQTEIEMIGKAVHRNLLRLLGFCVTPTERILVYPLMVNGSVASWLRGHTREQPPLPWEIRKKIALGAAKGLAYLHNDCKPTIIHRDVKAANILLDEEFEAIVADFGLVKFLEFEDSHVTTEVRGTWGYIAPEYVYYRRSSVKTDVFGYGATLMELISGKRPSDLASVASDEDITFTNWVERILKEKKWEILLDTNLKGNYVEDEVERFIQIALLCTQHSSRRRPKMLEVLRMLEGDDDGLASRWEEWQKLLLQGNLDQTDESNMNIDFGSFVDTTFKLQSEELSGPR